MLFVQHSADSNFFPMIAPRYRIISIILELFFCNVDGVKKAKHYKLPKERMKDNDKNSN